MAPRRRLSRSIAAIALVITSSSVAAPPATAPIQRSTPPLPNLDFFPGESVGRFVAPIQSSPQPALALPGMAPVLRPAPVPVSIPAKKVAFAPRPASVSSPAQQSVDKATPPIQPVKSMELAKTASPIETRADTDPAARPLWDAGFRPGSAPATPTTPVAVAKDPIIPNSVSKSDAVPDAMKSTTPALTPFEAGDRKQVAKRLVSEARTALKKGELDVAEAKVMLALAIAVQFSRWEDSPTDVQKDLSIARMRRDSQVQKKMPALAKPQGISSPRS